MKIYEIFSDMNINDSLEKPSYSYTVTIFATFD